MSKLKAANAEVVGVVSNGAIEDPSVEAWFLVNICYNSDLQGYDSPTRQRITKDGISYYLPWPGRDYNLKRRMYYTPDEQVIVKEAIKRYIANVRDSIGE